MPYRRWTPLCDSIAVANQGRSRKDLRGRSPPRIGPNANQAWRHYHPGRRDCGRGIFFWAGGPNRLDQIFPTRLRENSRCCEPTTLSSYNRRLSRRPRTGRWDRSPARSTPQANQARRHYHPERRDCTRGIFFGAGGPQQHDQTFPTSLGENPRCREPPTLPSYNRRHSRRPRTGQRGNGTRAQQGADPQANQARRHYPRAQGLHSGFSLRHSRPPRQASD